TTTTDKESNAAGTDNRPPMLEESDFESWKIRIERYIRGKPLGKLIWKSIKNGPTPHPTITITTGEDIQATNILSQGLPRHIFNILNQTETAKEIWENVKLLMQGSGLTEQQKKETLFDQYERTCGKGMQGEEETSIQTHSGSRTRALLMEAKERGTILDAEAEAFLADVKCTTPYAEPLAITTTMEFGSSKPRRKHTILMSM
ncbi:hypothetical protein Tco_0946620, partial [Tanacetum coccineum]